MEKQGKEKKKRVFNDKRRESNKRYMDKLSRVSIYLTPDEKAVLTGLADKEEKSVNSYVRTKLGFKETAGQKDEPASNEADEKESESNCGRRDSFRVALIDGDGDCKITETTVVRMISLMKDFFCTDSVNMLWDIRHTYSFGAKSLVVIPGSRDAKENFGQGDSFLVFCCYGKTFCNVSEEDINALRGLLESATA